MEFIDYFWSWLYSSVGAALNTLNQMINDRTLFPFYYLLVVIVATGVVIKYVLMHIKKKCSCCTFSELLL